ncbi:MAG TPA: hypothetical protein P5118_23310 [Planctomycetota bacterium]|nr:hypothetical protein [Planctomycetota bacterium]
MNPTPLIAQCWAAYFALCKRLGFDEDQRHEFNADNVGEPSTRLWSLPHWLMAVSLLQIASGRPGVTAGRPHLKGLRPDGRAAEDDPYPLDGSATRRQIAMIQDLAARKMRNPDALPNLVRRHAFTPSQAGLAAQWRGTLATLPRTVAARAILILRRLPDPGCAAQPPSAVAEEPVNV